MWEWEVIAKIIAGIAGIAGIARIIMLGISLYDRHKKSIISDKKIEREIKKICKRRNMDKIVGDGDLGVISDALNKKFKNRLPEELREPRDSRDYRVGSLHSYLRKFKWKSELKDGAIPQHIYYVPD